MAPKSNLLSTRSSHILVYKKGGGRIALFGLPFFIVGLFVAQIPFGIIPVEIEGGPIVLAILLPLGPLFAGVGFALMLSRSGFIVDRKNRSIIQWWGLLVPMKRKEYGFDSFAKVRIEYQAGDRNSPDNFPISIVGANLQTSLPIIDMTDYEMAVKSAEELARFIGKPIEDIAGESQNTGPPQ